MLLTFFLVRRLTSPTSLSRNDFGLLNRFQIDFGARLRCSNDVGEVSFLQTKKLVGSMIPNAASGKARRSYQLTSFSTWNCDAGAGSAAALTLRSYARTLSRVAAPMAAPSASEDGDSAGARTTPLAAGQAVWDTASGGGDDGALGAPASADADGAAWAAAQRQATAGRRAPRRLSPRGRRDGMRRGGAPATAERSRECGGDGWGDGGGGCGGRVALRDCWIKSPALCPADVRHPRRVCEDSAARMARRHCGGSNAPVVARTQLCSHAGRRRRSRRLAHRLLGRDSRGSGRHKRPRLGLADGVDRRRDSVGGTGPARMPLGRAQTEAAPAGVRNERRQQG